MIQAFIYASNRALRREASLAHWDPSFAGPRLGKISSNILRCRSWSRPRLAEGYDDNEDEVRWRTRDKITIAITWLYVLHQQWSLLTRFGGKDTDCNKGGVSFYQNLSMSLPEAPNASTGPRQCHSHKSLHLTNGLPWKATLRIFQSAQYQRMPPTSLKLLDCISPHDPNITVVLGQGALSPSSLRTRRSFITAWWRVGAATNRWYGWWGYWLSS